MSVYVEFPIIITQDEVNTFCLILEDQNPQHNPNNQKVVIPGMLIAAKALGKPDSSFVTWLIEQQVRFKKIIYIDEPIIVRHTLLKERNSSKGLLQEVEISVKVGEEIRYTGHMKTLKTIV